MINKKLKRLVMFWTVCKIKGHKESYMLFHNGFKKGTYRTHKQKPLYQMKCERCNRFFGKKERCRMTDLEKKLKIEAKTTMASIYNYMPDVLEKFANIKDKDMELFMIQTISNAEAEKKQRYSCRLPYGTIRDEKEKIFITR